jgi:hypothetical protein
MAPVEGAHPLQKVNHPFILAVIIGLNISTFE